MVEKRVNKFGKVSSTPHPLLSGKNFFLLEVPPYRNQAKLFWVFHRSKTCPWGLSEKEIGPAPAALQFTATLCSKEWKL